MTPFLQLRLWCLRSSLGERVAATLAGAIALALFGWILVPTSSGTDNIAVRSGDATSAAGATSADSAGPNGADGTSGTMPTAGATTEATPTVTDQSDPTAGAPAPGGNGGSGPAAAAAGPRCPPTPQGARGVTDDVVSIDMALLDLAGPIGNGAVGQMSADEAERMSRAVINDLNARGGAACRQVKAKFYKVNPISPSAQQAACMDMVQDRPALVLDVGGIGYGGGYNCPAQQRVPTLASGAITLEEAAKFGPFLAGPGGSAEGNMMATAQGIREQGLLDPGKGFVKLGILADECVPTVPRTLIDRLIRGGLSRGQISTYSFACPEGGFASPGDMSQAVVQHRSAGVTHVVVLTGSGSFNSYAETAERQGYRPRYVATDYQALIVTAASNLRPNAANFNGALAITTTTFGLDTTSGLSLDPGSVRCQRLVKAAGLPPEALFRGGGALCAFLWTAEAALNKAASLAPEAILPGLRKAGTIQMSYPVPDVTFNHPGGLYGGNTYWPLKYESACNCWRVVDPNRRQTPRT